MNRWTRLLEQLVGPRPAPARFWSYRLVDCGVDGLRLCEVHFRDGRPVSYSVTGASFDAFDDFNELSQGDLRAEIVRSLERAVDAARNAPIISAADIGR